MVEIMPLLMARPILNTILLAAVGSICYFFTWLYEARMLFIRRKRMGLVGLSQSTLYFPDIDHC